MLEFLLPPDQELAYHDFLRQLLFEMVFQPQLAQEGHNGQDMSPI